MSQEPFPQEADPEEPEEEVRAEARGISAEPSFLQILLLLSTQQEIPTHISLLQTYTVEADPCPCWEGQFQRIGEAAESPEVVQKETPSGQSESVSLGMDTSRPAGILVG